MSMHEQYLKLWQQKREELPVESLPQTDWLAMQQLLDVEMPVIRTDAGNNNSDAGSSDTPSNGASNTSNAGGSNLGTQITQFIQAKLLYITAVVITSAAVTYTVVKHNATPKDEGPVKTEFRADSVLRDSLTNELLPDSLTQQNILTDSLLSTKIDADSADKNSPNISGNRNSAHNGSDVSTENKNGATDKKVTDNKLISNNKANNAPNRINSGATGGGNTSRLPASTNKINNGGALNGNRGSNSSKFSQPNGRLSAYNGSKPNNGRQLNNLNTSTRRNIGDGSNSFQKYIMLQPLNSSSSVFMNDDKALVNNYNAVGIDEITKANAALIAGRTALIGTNGLKNSSTKIKEDKSAKVKPTKTPRIPGNGPDWGILAGVSVPGSFAPKVQNNNFYGSLPIDIFTGAFVTANIIDKWALDLQLKLLIPNKANETYDHMYTTRNDTGGIVRNTLKINESRKIYSAQIPVYAVYNISPSVSIKAGPVVNIPLKYYRLSSITPTTAFQDTAGYIGKLMDTLNAIKYDTKLSFGLSTGLSYTYKRLRLEATYYFSPHQIKVTSPLSTYSKTGNNLQISVGFNLNKPKP